MKCSTSRNYINKYFGYDLTKEQNRQLQDHLKTCSVCKKIMLEEKQIISAIQGMPQLSPSENLKSNIWQGIEARKATRSFYLKPLLGGVSLVVTALLFIVMIPNLGIKEKSYDQKTAGLNVQEELQTRNVDKTAKNIKQEWVEKEDIKQEPVKKQQVVKSWQPVEKLIAKETASDKVRHIVSGGEQKRINKTIKPKKIAQKQEKRLNNLQQSGISVVNKQQIVSKLYNNEPSTFKIYKNVINVNKNETSRFELVLEQQSNVSIVIYSKTGRPVKTMVSKILASGPYEWSWQGRNDAGQILSSGIYFAICQIEGQPVNKQKIIIIK